MITLWFQHSESLAMKIRTCIKLIKANFSLGRGRSKGPCYFFGNRYWYLFEINKYRKKNFEQTVSSKLCLDILKIIGKLDVFIFIYEKIKKATLIVKRSRFHFISSDV